VILWVSSQPAGPWAPSLAVLVPSALMGQGRGWPRSRDPGTGGCCPRPGRVGGPRRWWAWGGMGRGYGPPEPPTLPWKHSQALLQGDAPCGKKCWKTPNEPIPSSGGWPGGAGRAVAPCPPRLLGHPAPSVLGQPPGCPGAGGSRAALAWQSPRAGVVWELTGSGREALPSPAGFRQRRRPNRASVTRSEAGRCADEDGSDEEPSSSTPMAR